MNTLRIVGLLFLISCLQSIGNASLIEFLFGKPSPITKAKCADCPQGWMLNNGKCYKNYKMLVSYSNAAKVCKEDNSTVAMPKTVGEINFIYKQLSSSMDLFQNATGYLWVRVE